MADLTFFGLFDKSSSSYVSLLLVQFFWASVGALSGFLPIFIAEKFCRKVNGSNLFYLLIFTIPICSLVSAFVSLFVTAGLNADPTIPMLILNGLWYLFWVTFGFTNWHNMTSSLGSKVFELAHSMIDWLQSWWNNGSTWIVIESSRT